MSALGNLIVVFFDTQLTYLIILIKALQSDWSVQSQCENMHMIIAKYAFY